MKLINVGFGNAVNADRVIAVVSTDSAPVKRIISQAKDNHMLIDATQGRKTHAILIMDSDHIVATYLKAETILSRTDSLEDTDDEK
ncbi:MAG: DUF370 domain-containing protein [Clostridia bacterium]|nr:DUF370 domain-containing protein [Clostridia bacterium]MBR5545299.1 DUF370 domain-containing protein [Clostridia bacterium]